MVDRLDRLINTVYDALEARWETVFARRTVATVLVLGFFVALIAIEAARQGWLPGALNEMVPKKHYYAIDVAFTLFLIAEVIGLVFGLAQSVADSVGKQFEIFSLILLRQSFKELAAFSEPIEWTTLGGPVLQLISDAMGALVIFVIVGFYYRMQRHWSITEGPEQRRQFVTSKKFVALALLVLLAAVGVEVVYDVVTGRQVIPFFDTFYTILIFSDVLIVFLSLRYSTTYHIVFRNSGFAVATILIRLALAGPPYLNAALGIVAALFAVGLTWAYNQFQSDLEKATEESDAGVH